MSIISFFSIGNVDHPATNEDVKALTKAVKANKDDNIWLTHHLIELNQLHIGGGYIVKVGCEDYPVTNDDLGLFEATVKKFSETGGTIVTPYKIELSEIEEVDTVRVIAI